MMSTSTFRLVRAKEKRTAAVRVYQGIYEYAKAINTKFSMTGTTTPAHADRRVSAYQKNKAVVLRPVHHPQEHRRQVHRPKRLVQFANVDWHVLSRQPNVPCVPPHVPSCCCGHPLSRRRSRRRRYMHGTRHALPAAGNRGQHTSSHRKELVA